MQRALLACGVALIVGSGQAHAHHSFAAEFDAARPMTFTGTIVTVEWVNPHSMLWIDVRGAGGRPEQSGSERRGPERWGFELSPPNALMRRGLRRAMLRPGDRITIRAYPARDGRRFASTQALVLANGRTVELGLAGRAVNPRNPAGTVR
ncbi:MAG: DUF6152 family protein [Vicinamibacterales bacterium]|nr:DUF6152 family protein [Vicinamibacterales bacterium]